MSYQEDNLNKEKLEDKGEEEVEKLSDEEKNYATEDDPNTINVSQEERTEFNNLYKSQKINEKEYSPIEKLKDLSYAGFFKRLVAFVIDMVLAISIWNIFKNLTGITLARGFIYYNINLIAYCIYSFFMVLLTDGYTLGKMMMNVRVVSLDSDRLGVVQVLAREVAGKIILVKIPFIALMVLFSKKNQHLGDMLSDTAVVDGRILEVINQLNDMKIQA